MIYLVMLTVINAIPTGIIKFKITINSIIGQVNDAQIVFLKIPSFGKKQFNIIIIKIQTKNTRRTSFPSELLA